MCFGDNQTCRKKDIYYKTRFSLLHTTVDSTHSRVRSGCIQHGPIHQPKIVDFSFVGHRSCPLCDVMADVLRIGNKYDDDSIYTSCDGRTSVCRSGGGK